ncbi:hypothetical protein NMG60_11027460 [Bertholletia excelsa]
MVSCLDLRYAVLIVINIVKSHVGAPWDWDPYNIILGLTWSKFWLLSISILFFSFTSIALPLNCPLNLSYVSLRFKRFSTSLAILLVASLVFSQVHFWFVYFIFLIFSQSYFFDWLSYVLRGFIQWVQVSSSNIPDLNINLKLEPQPSVEDGEALV